MCVLPDFLLGVLGLVLAPSGANVHFLVWAVWWHKVGQPYPVNLLHSGIGTPNHSTVDGEPFYQAPARVPGLPERCQLLNVLTLLKTLSLLISLLVVNGLSGHRALWRLTNHSGLSGFAEDLPYQQY